MLRAVRQQSDATLDCPVAGNPTRIRQAPPRAVGWTATKLGLVQLLCRLQFAVEPAAVLVPVERTHFGGGAFRPRRRNNGVRMVKLNVPAQDAPHFGQRGRAVQQLQKGVILANKIEDVNGRVWIDAISGAIFGLYAIERRVESRHRFWGDGVAHNKIAVAVERRALCLGEAMLQGANIHWVLLGYESD